MPRSTFFRALGRSAGLLLLLSPLAAAAQQANPFAELGFRAIGPAVTGGRVHDVQSLADDPSTIWVASATGGLWKSTNRGTTWAPVFDGQPTGTFGVLAVAPSDPRRGVGGHRRAEQPTEQLLGERRLPQHGRRAHVDPPRSGEHPRHRPHPGRPDRPGRGPRGGPGQPLGPVVRPRRVPHGGRWAHVDQGALRGHAHGRGGHGARRRRPRHHLCRRVPTPAAAVGVQRRGAGERDLPEHGRRRHLAASERGPSAGRHGPHRRGHLRPHTRAGLRRRGARHRGGHLPHDRRRRALGADERHELAPGLLQRPVRGPHRRRPPLPADALVLLQRGRGRHLADDAHRADVRRGPQGRLSCDVDRPHGLEALLPRRRRRPLPDVGPGGDVRALREHPHRPVLRARPGRPVALLDLRRNAGQPLLAGAERHAPLPGHRGRGLARDRLQRRPRARRRRRRAALRLQQRRRRRPHAGGRLHGRPPGDPPGGRRRASRSCAGSG